MANPLKNFLQMKLFNISMLRFSSDSYETDNDELLRTAITTTQSSSTTQNQVSSNILNSNLKIISIAIAVIIFGLCLLRILYALFKSSHTVNNLPTNRPMTFMQPHLATIEHPYFKEDLPPTYSEATAVIDIDETKLPSYSELHNEQRAHSSNTISTQ